MAEIIIIGGPNGAGKTSFADYFLRSPGDQRPFVDADEIAREMTHADTSRERLDLLAAREMLRRRRR